MKKFISTLGMLVLTTMQLSASLIFKPVIRAPLCSDATGTITLIAASNGIPPFSYNWCCGLPPDSMQTGLVPGDYTVTVV